nr:hypothetical protein [Tanacetum cinerariifolium]
MYLNLWSYKVVRHRYSNLMIQPEPEGSTQGYLLVSVEVLRILKDGGEAKTSLSLNDNEEGPSGRDDNVHQPVLDFENQPGHGDQHFATPIDDNPSDGKGGSHLEELCDLPVGRKPIGSKWVYRIKYMSSGEIERFKARLVAKGFGQKEEIDYEETFSPMVKMGTVSDYWHNELEIENFKKFLKNKFKIKYLGELKYFLGIEVLKTKIGLYLTQMKYCLKLLHDFGLLGCKPVMTPLPENIVLAQKESENDKFLHMHSPLKSHLDIAMRVLKYLKLAPSYGIQSFKRNSVFDINSKKQSTLSRSSTEAGYRSMASVTCEIMWIVKIIKDLNVDNLIPINLYYDKKSAIQIATNPVMHEKTKHFDLDVHLVREKVSSGLIKTVKVNSRENVDDILTKALGSYQHSYLVKKFGVRCIGLR